MIETNVIFGYLVMLNNNNNKTKKKKENGQFSERMTNMKKTEENQLKQVEKKHLVQTEMKRKKTCANFFFYISKAIEADDKQTKRMNTKGKERSFYRFK